MKITCPKCGAKTILSIGYYSDLYNRCCAMLGFGSVPGTWTIICDVCSYTKTEHFRLGVKIVYIIIWFSILLAISASICLFFSPFTGYPKNYLIKGVVVVVALVFFLWLQMKTGEWLLRNEVKKLYPYLK